MFLSLYMLQSRSYCVQRDALSLFFWALHWCCVTHCIHTACWQITCAWLQLCWTSCLLATVSGMVMWLRSLVHVTGMKFFPGYVNDARRQLLDAAAFRWHQTGQQQKQLMKWRDRSQLQGGMLMLEAPTPPAVAQKGKQGRPRQDLLPSSAPVAGSSTQTSGVAALVSGLCTSGKTVPVPLAVY